MDALNPLPPLPQALSNAYDPEGFRSFGHKMVDMLADHLEHSQNRGAQSSFPGHTPSEEIAFWKAALHGGAPSDQGSVLKAMLQRSNQLHDPRYMGHQVAVPLPQEAWVGAMTDLMNNGQAIFEMGPSNAALEELLLQEIGQMLGLPEDCGGILCHGGTLGNLVALLAAQRHASLQQGGDSWTEGIQPGTVAILVSEQAHYCIDRAVRILGWGAEAIVLVETDDHHRMDLDDLAHKAQALTSQGKTILALVGSACTTSTGAFDPLQNMAEWAEAHDVWFHVDGAHGAPVAFSETHRHLVQGMDRAQSVVMDFHKLCGLPALCTGVFYRDRGQSFLPFLQEAEYLWSDAAQKDWWDTGKRTLECTKRMLSTRLMSLRSGPGYDIWGTLVDRLWEVASFFASEVRLREGWELAMTPQANIVCFRPKAFQKMTATEIQAHRATYLRNGSGYVVSTSIHGERWLRCTFMNPLTEARDLREMLAQWDDILAAD